MEHQQWQSLLKLGNHCFHEKEWSKAEYFYSEAYDLLAFSYRNNPMCADTLMAWVCTCHNLSYLYEIQGNLDLSLQFLLVPHDYLKGIAESNTLNDDIKGVALKGMSLTHPPILLFTKKYSVCDDCRSFVEIQSKTLEKTSVTLQ